MATALEKEIPVRDLSNTVELALVAGAQERWQADQLSFYLGLRLALLSLPTLTSTPPTIS